MKIIIRYTLFFAIAGLTACSYSRDPEHNYNPEDPGFEYNLTTDMYYSVPYDPVSQWDFNTNHYNPDSINEREPAKGTIAWGKLDYYFRYPNTNEGYEAAGKELHSPIAKNDSTMAEGKRLYEIYCWHCHGLEGNADGPVAQWVKPPKYSVVLPTITEGKMFFSVTYGKNLMGSHASQLSPTQRWLIINYIQTLAKATPATAATAEAPKDSAQTKPATK